MAKKREIMYHEVKRLSEMQLSQRKTAEALNVNRRTVKRYEEMTGEEFEAFTQKISSKPKLLDRYKEFIVKRLNAAPLASSAQVHDWLKEFFADFPDVSIKTVYNYVMAIRQEYHITMESVSRGMLMQSELPLGKQAQIDFGVYNLTTNEGSKKKVHFFVMVLSCSRMRFVLFSQKPFTTQTTIEAHEEAFAYFGGIPHELVYDQDRVMMVSENLGELLLTQQFRSYVASHKLGLHFCRKSDPASKGKVENSVKYVKHNFLYGRKFFAIEILQQEALAWLDRTANANKHNVTGLVPKEVWLKEVDHLRPFIPAKITDVFKEHAVRKDSVISYKGNFYSVPVGLYKKGLKVLVGCKGDELIINELSGKFICKHSIPDGKNKKVINNNHKRDTSIAIEELKQKAVLMFPDKAKATVFLNAVHKKFPRYVRDQFLGLIRLLTGQPSHLIEQALNKCLDEKEYGCQVFKETLQELTSNEQSNKDTQTKVISIMRNKGGYKADIQPATRSLDVYDNLIEKPTVTSNKTK